MSNQPTTQDVGNGDSNERRTVRTSEDDQECEHRSARVARDREGDLLGLAVFFGPEDLRALGVEPTDSEITYGVMPDGEISVVSGKGDQGGDDE